MGKKVVDVDLSTDGILKAVKFINDYNRWVGDMTNMLVRRLAKIGKDIAQSGDDEARRDGSEGGTLSVDVDQVGLFTTRATISYKGTQVAFIEFGAGVHFNTPVGTSGHPLGEQFGYTIGSYGYGLGKFDSWTKPDGTRTHGTHAEMPMWNARKFILDNLEIIAKDVFA